MHHYNGRPIVCGGGAGKRAWTNPLLKVHGGRKKIILGRKIGAIIYEVNKVPPIQSCPEKNECPLATLRGGGGEQ